MGTFNGFSFCIFCASLFTVFVKIQTKPLILEHPSDPEFTTASSMNKSYDPLTSEFDLISTTSSDLNGTSSNNILTFGANNTNISTGNMTDQLDIEDILNASSDDDMFSVSIDQSGESNSTESMEGETMSSDESGSGSMGLEANKHILVDEKHILDDNVDESLNGTAESIHDVGDRVGVVMNSTEVGNFTGEGWTTDSLGFTIPALMFA